MADERNMQSAAGSTYWRSLRELHNDGVIDDLKAHEFVAGTTDDFDPGALSPMSRKRFLALVTASAAFAAAGCSGYRDKGEIVPYTKKPEEVTPGVSDYYASTCTGCSQLCGVLIKTREGRPVKIDGNPDHPVNRGTLCAKGQASILGLYDPERLRTPSFGLGKSGDLAWEKADREVRKALDEAVRAGKQIAVLIRPTLSLSAERMYRLFAERYPTAKFYPYELFNEETRRDAWERCYGTREVPAIAWERASIVLALESDFLGAEGPSVESVRRFSARRDIMTGQDFNRLYAVEGSMSLTGANADYRLRLRPDRQFDFLCALLNEAGIARKAVGLDATIASLVREYPLSGFASANGLATATLSHLVDDLLANRGKAVLHAGPALPVDVHILVNYLNALLGNDAVYDHTGARSAATTVGGETLDALVRSMLSGSVGVVVHVQTNPVYDLPRALNYREALERVPVSVCLTSFADETSERCTYVLPVHHALESWGDFAPRTGLRSTQQPVVAPLYNSRQAEAVLLYWSSNEQAFRETLYLEFIKGVWEKEVYPAASAQAPFPAFWNAALHDGVIRGGESRTAPSAIATSALSGLKSPTVAKGMTVVLNEPYFVGDGRFANNGWLQELPHPISKIVWDNYAAISPATAAGLGVSSNDLVTVQLQHGSQTLPVFVQPGVAENVVAIDLGYGRWNAGPVGTRVGFDAGMLLPVGGLTGSRVLTGAVLAKAGGTYELVSTQEHHALDDTLLKDLHLKRKIIREGTLDEFRRDNEFLHKEKEELSSITHEVEYNGVKWAMAIDLNKCVGCQACVSGCNVENNIPVVGKEQVQKGREMQWIRLDRYFSGTPDEPSLSHQPMLCQHCDNAPCENVCPVSATNHSPDGLNQMVYNRCVGTKYCSNNCPYKVRRFNFYNFRDNFADGYYLQEPVSLGHNPEVTVRSRGVMEKCTFCIQRIAEARQHAAEQGRPLSGNDVKTACQVACPAEAIVFGDMNDPASAVSAYRKHPLGYHVLEELNARPNVTYLARLRNIHPEKSA